MKKAWTCHRKRKRDSIILTKSSPGLSLSTPVFQEGLLVTELKAEEDLSPWQALEANLNKLQGTLAF